jgi:DNA-binding CsgD family transcriptional regulator
LEIVGRERELALAHAFLESAAVGFAVLEFEGEAGIGKTTLWRTVLRHAEERGFCVLACRPAAAEAKLSLSAISDLLEHVPDDAFAALPEPQRRALDVALVRADAGEAILDQRSVAVALRSLVRALAVVQPVLVAVDDIHWLDTASAATLEFALRRLRPEPVGFVTSCRTGEQARLKVDDLVEPELLTTVTLGPLTLASLHHLVRQRLQEIPSRPTLIRIAKASHGNPLFALELARLLAEIGAPPPGEPLPVPADFDSLVRRRIARLPPATREVLLAAASLSDAREDVVGSALRRPIVADMEPAEREQIASLERGVVTFAHPLFAAAIYSSATTAERRRMHRGLAETLDDSEARARHLALAAGGRDEAAAAAAHAAAAVAARRGAPDAAVELVELALELTERGSEAEPVRLLDFAGYLHANGQSERAQAVLEALDSWESWPPSLSARAVDLLADLLSFTEGPSAFATFGERAMRESLSPQARAAVHLALSYSAGFDDAQRSLEHAAAALRLLEPLGDEVDAGVLASALTIRLRAGAVLGHGLDGDLVERVLALEAGAPPRHHPSSAALGGWFRWIDDLDASRHLVTRALERAVKEGHEPDRAGALCHLALTECLAGELEAAREHAASALSLSQELEAGGLTTLAADALALVEAHLGNVDEVYALQQRHAGGSATRREAVLGVLELSRARYEAADRHLSTSLELIEATGIREPGIYRVHADAAEAAVALGDLERAERIARFLEEHGEGRHHRWSSATGARVQALLAAARGDLDEASRACEQALAHHEALPMPLERARTLLVKGIIDRRARRRRQAKESFEKALELFEASGARLWAERARAELARVGLRRSPGNALTEGERSVAALTARGLTRRQAAAALHVSPKTVDATLGRVYRKLGIGSRAELGARMAELQM